VFPGRFNQRERPDFVWDIFAAPTDLTGRWNRNRDLVLTWQPARAIIEVKAIQVDHYESLRDFRPGNCATPQEYLALKLRPTLVKADRQIRAARGLIAGQGSLGVLVLVNENSDTLPRTEMLAVLEQGLTDRGVTNTDLIVYMHDWGFSEPQPEDRPPTQRHPVSVVGDPSKALNREFVRELKDRLTAVFRPERFVPIGTQFTKVYSRTRRTVTTSALLPPDQRRVTPGELWFDPEGRWAL
jgi:hypothetical protein